MEQKKTSIESPTDDKSECPTCFANGDPNPAHRASYVGHVECLKNVFRALTDTRTLLDSENNSPLHAAVAGGQVDIIKYLLQFTRIPVQYQNNHGETCVHISALRHKLECMKILLNGSFKKSQSYAIVKDRLGCTVLHYAVLVNDNDCSLYLLQRFGKNLANISNDDGVLPLHVAAAQGNIEFIQIATKYDVLMVNRRDRNGATAAFYSVQSGYLQCLKYLVEKSKADVHTLTGRGQSLLHAACLNGHASIVQWLFTKMEKSAVYQQTNDAATTFHCASFGGHSTILKILHKLAGNRRFAVNSTDRRGNTALHLAALNGHLDCVKILVQLGAEPRVKNFNGHTTIEVADMRNQQNVVAYLTASITGSKDSLKKKYVRHKSHSDVSTVPAEDIRPNSLSTSGYSSGAAASDGYGRTALPLNSLHYNEPSSGYASSSDKGTKEPITGIPPWKSRSLNLHQSNDVVDPLTFTSNKTNWLLRRKDVVETNENLEEKFTQNNYGVSHQLPIDLMSPHKTTTTYGGPILVSREIQTDFDPLDQNVIIVDELERVIFSSEPSIPTIFTKSQQKVVINQMSETTTTTNDDSETSKKLKKRRRKPAASPRERSKKSLNKNTTHDSDFWSSAEMKERKRNSSSISSSSSDDSDMVIVHVEKNSAQMDSNKATIYAGIAAAERIDEYLKSELDDITDSDSVRTKNSYNITTAVAEIHKSSDDLQYSPLTLDRRSILNLSDKTFFKVDRRPSGLGPQLTLPIMHDPHVRRRSDVQPYAADGTLDVKTYKTIEDKYFSTLNPTISVRSDRSLSTKSASLGDLNGPENASSTNFGSKRTSSSSRSMMDLNDSNLDFKSSAHEGEYGTLRSTFAHLSNSLPHIGDDSWSKNEILPKKPPPPPPALPASSSSMLQNNRLFYKKSAATTFKARDKILSDHIKTSQTTSTPSDIGEQTLNKKTVSAIRRRLEDKLISHVNSNNSTSGSTFELQTNHQPPISNSSSLSGSYQQMGFDEGDKSKNGQQQNYRYFGTSNGSDYALRGRINDIIRLGSACLYKKSDNKMYEIDEETEETLAGVVGSVVAKSSPIEEKRFETPATWNLPTDHGKNQEINFEIV